MIYTYSMSIKTAPAPAHTHTITRESAIADFPEALARWAPDPSYYTEEVLAGMRLDGALRDAEIAGLHAEIAERAWDEGLTDELFAEYARLKRAELEAIETWLAYRRAK